MNEKEWDCKREKSTEGAQEKDSFLTPEEISIFSIYCSQFPDYMSQSVSQVFGVPRINVACIDTEIEAPEVVSDRKVIYCENCCKNFANSAARKAHCCVDKGFLCEVCGKGFISLGNLKRHAIVHTGEKPYECPDCSKRFSTNGHLTEHYRMHSGERPFKCHCGKSFRRSNTLKKHKYIHTGEKPIKCPVCLKGFIDSGNLKIHLRTHTNERPFLCSFPNCPKSFKTKAHLQDHMSIKLHSTLTTQPKSPNTQ